MVVSRADYLLKLACTFVSALIVTEQVPVPAQAPVQPRNASPAGGVAVRTTVEPALYFAAQVPPQLMAPTLAVTVPLLDLATDRV